ncbi:MAG: DUF3048 domain-containing protein [Candidatus Dormibacterales bacterium]
MVHLPIRLSRTQAIGAAAGAAAIVVAAVLLVVHVVLGASLGAKLEASNLARVKILEPVVIVFDQPVDPRGVSVTASPATPLKLSWSGQRLVVAAAGHWQPSQRYTLALDKVLTRSHRASLTGWKGTFTTQPDVAVAAYEVDGKPVAAGTAGMTSASTLSVVFTQPMRTSSVSVNLGGRPVTSLSWSAQDTVATFAEPTLAPFQTTTLGVSRTAVSAKGDEIADPGQVSLQVMGLEPANSTTGVTAGFQTKTPVEIVVENSGAARPQTGLQNADIVYEYISEYSITRMTAIYFNNVPPLVGPVRSCRMINPYLDYSFDGVFMCSGASVGTLHYLFGGNGLPLVPGIINDFDNGNHFFRVGFKYAPHNLYTDSARILRFRREWSPGHSPTFVVDPPHPDSGAGVSAPAPSVPLHFVTYHYDPASQQYLRFDHGAPFVDAGTGRQLHVKNVIILHVPFHYTNWIEDENGGAHSVWYSMLGSGPADIYSDGKVIHVTWHMGSSTESYFHNHNPVYFTDAQGNVVRLNTGLTWVHLLGVGQTQ